MYDRSQSKAVVRMGRRTVRGSWTKGGPRREGNRVEWKGAGRGRTGGREKESA